MSQDEDKRMRCVDYCIIQDIMIRSLYEFVDLLAFLGLIVVDFENMSCLNFHYVLLNPRLCARYDIISLFLHKIMF